jgi:hypothetical protein
VGTSVTPNVELVRLYRSATTSASHTITALTSSTVSVDGSGSYSTGSTITGVIPGVNIVLGSGALTVGDTSTFSTYATGLTILSGQVAAFEQDGATYTTGLLDASGQVFSISQSFSGGATSPLFFTLESVASLETDSVGTPIPLPMLDPDVPDEPVQWVVAAWEEHPLFPVQTGTVKVGNTRNPTDATWWQTLASTTPGPGYLAITHDSLRNGDSHGYLGMAAMPRARYSVVTFGIPAGGFLRNLRFYCWNPDDDGERDRFPELPGDDLSLRYLSGHIAAICMDLRDPFREAQASLSYGTAMGKGLDARFAEWGIVRPYGMDDDKGAALLRMLNISKSLGCTVKFINAALSLVLGPNVPFSTRTLKTTTSQWILGTSSLGVDTYLSPVTVGQFQAMLSIATDMLTCPPQDIEALINLFLPVGVNLTLVWS